MSEEEYWERLRETWRLERLREDEMLAFYDQIEGKMTRKALAEKFNLKTTRVCLLVRNHLAYQERGRLQDEIEQLKANTFVSLAERLWMTLGWLAQELEERSRYAARDPR
jgi:hypothetical protein